MGKSKTLDFVFGDKHVEYMRRTREATINAAEGAVRAGKTVDNVFAFAHELETAPDKLHLATGSTIANAKLNIGDCNGYGLEGIFRGRCRWGKYKDNECLRIKTKTGLKVVIFAGGGKADSFKKIRGNSYGMWIATEINLHHDNTIKEAFNRQLAAKHRKIYWDLNPDNPNATIYTEYIDKYAKQQAAGEFLGGFNYEHFTIWDNKTISEQRLKEVTSQYDAGSIWYRRDMLGERCASNGLIYSMFSPDKNTYPTRPLGLEYLATRTIACDYGTTNPCVFLDIYDDGETVWVDREYRWDSKGKKEQGRQKTDSEYADDLLEFMGDDPQLQCAVVVDPSAASFIVELQRRGVYVIQGDNDVLNGIRRVSQLFHRRILKVNQGCVGLIGELGGYLWDAKAALIGEERPIKMQDHGPDALRYYVNTCLPKWRYGEE